MLAVLLLLLQSSSDPHPVYDGRLHQIEVRVPRIEAPAVHIDGVLDEATWQLFAAVGLTPAWLRAHDRGMAAVEQHLRYLRELMPGDVVSVRTRVLEVKDKSLRFEHAMRHDVDGAPVATGPR